jgi:hypothetical protein
MLMIALVASHCFISLHEVSNCDLLRECRSVPWTVDATGEVNAALKACADDADANEEVTPK